MNKQQRQELLELLKLSDDELSKHFNLLNAQSAQAEQGFKSGGICTSPKFASVKAMRQWFEALVSSKFALECDAPFSQHDDPGVVIFDLPPHD